MPTWRHRALRANSGGPVWATFPSHSWFAGSQHTGMKSRNYAVGTAGRLQMLGLLSQTPATGAAPWQPHPLTLITLVGQWLL